MAQENQIQRGSNSSGSGFLVGSLNSRSSSKKPNQRKVPQRGLGVAQLEKIRLEEQQQNKDVADVASASILSSPSLPILNHHHSKQSSSSISFPTVSQADLSSSNSITRPSLPAQSVGFDNSVSPPLVNQTSCIGFEAMGPGIAMLGQDEGPKMWSSCEYVKRGNGGADHGLPFKSNVFLPYKSNFSCPPMQFTHEHQQSSSLSVNSASAMLSSSMLNFPMDHPSNKNHFPMEPPSNQNYYYHYLARHCPDEEKICSVKRPYSFALDNPSGLSSNYQSHTTIPIRSDTSALYENGGSSRNLNLRKKSYTESSVSGDFLTLATPSAYPAFHYHKLPDFESLPFQTCDKPPTFKSEQRSLPFYSFFPPADVTHISHDASQNNGEIGEFVDLNLKL